MTNYKITIDMNRSVTDFIPPTVVQSTIMGQTFTTFNVGITPTDDAPQEIPESDEPRQYYECLSATFTDGFTLAEVLATIQSAIGITRLTTDELRAIAETSHALDYATIVSAIVTAAYPQDRMQAIINNKLLDDSDTEHEAQFIAMQAWRKTAKEMAEKCLTT